MTSRFIIKINLEIPKSWFEKIDCSKTEKE